jgi:S-formylglutathione hydrolase FrmB
MLEQVGASVIGLLKSGAIAGAAIVFSWRYLAGFIQAAIQPMFGPGEHPELLDVPTLVYRVITIAALALLCAFIGSSVGHSLAEVLLDPLFALGTMVKSVLVRRKWAGEKQPGDRCQLVTEGIVAMMFVALIGIVATSSINLFLISPDAGLHLVLIFSKHMQMKVGTVVTDHVGGKAFMVYLPPSYNTPQANTRRYPVLYLLHGSPGGIRDWLVAGKADESANTLITLNETAELILVMPDGNGRPGATSEWANSLDRQQLIENYVSYTVVRYVDQHYRTLPDAAHRAIGGLSMGGFGAMNIAIHHSGIFGSVIALGGYYVAEGAIWGQNAAYEQANSPLDTIVQAKAAWKLHIYLGAAISDAPYYADTLQFARILTNLKIPYTLDIQPGGHSWKVWQTQLYHAMIWLPWSGEELEGR